VVTAAGDGATAAIRADQYVTEHFGPPAAVMKVTAKAPAAT
jgi:hypothetical protein